MVHFFLDAVKIFPQVICIKILFLVLNNELNQAILSQGSVGGGGREALGGRSS